MQKSSVNEITVTNVSDNEAIYHSFLLLKIKVHHVDCTKNPNNIKMQVTVGNEGESTMHYDATTNDNIHYKCLIELNHSENRICLNYCCLSTSLNVKYLRRETQFQIVPIYIINEGHDGTFQAPETQSNSMENAWDRILTGCKLLQCFISEKLVEQGFSRKTFQIESDRCIVFNSKLHWESAINMAPNKLWAYLGREIMHSKIGCENKKYFGFLACTRYNGSRYKSEIKTHDEIVGLTDGYVALGGGGLALFGTACLYTWPENVHDVVRRFEDCALVDKTRFMDDSCYRGTLGACFSTTLGSALHELCHTFDLGHTEQGIMGRGFDNISEFFTSTDPETTQTELFNNNNVIRSFMALNGIYFTQSGAALLYYHKFFNSFPVNNQNFTLSFDGKSNLLKSIAGLRVVEIRDDAYETVIRHWVFPGRILRFSFQIPHHFDDGFIIVVEDNAGNILKCNL